MLLCRLIRNSPSGMRGVERSWLSLWHGSTLMYTYLWSLSLPLTSIVSVEKCDGDGSWQRDCGLLALWLMSHLDPLSLASQQCKPWKCFRCETGTIWRDSKPRQSKPRQSLYPTLYGSLLSCRDIFTDLKNKLMISVVNAFCFFYLVTGYTTTFLENTMSDDIFDYNFLLCRPFSFMC